MSFPAHDVLGLPVEHCSAADAVAAMIRWATAGEGGYVCIANVHMLVTALDDPGFTAVFRDAKLRLPDSMVVQRARAFLHGAPAPDTLLGSRLTVALAQEAAAQAAPIGLLGGTPGTLAAVAERLRAQAPGLAIAFEESPPFRPLSDDDVAGLAGRVAASGARLLLVALGCPKQERLMARLAPHLPHVVQAGVGAAFDTIAGVVPASPPWVHAAGLEWAYRLAREPKRLWRRYASTNPRFLAGVALQKLTGRAQKPQGVARPGAMRG